MMAASRPDKGVEGTGGGRGPALDHSAVQAISRLAGVELTSERLAELMTQADAHFGLLEVVSGLDPGESEPAGEFRLDRLEDGRNG
jgi:hypothetical protein